MTPPWSLLATALVFILISLTFVAYERRRYRKDPKAVEHALASIVTFAQKQHERKFGRPSQELTAVQSSLSTMNGARRS